MNKSIQLIYEVHKYALKFKEESIMPNLSVTTNEIEVALGELEDYLEETHLNEEPLLDLRFSSHILRVDGVDFTKLKESENKAVTGDEEDDAVMHLRNWNDAKWFTVMKQLSDEIYKLRQENENLCDRIAELELREKGYDNTYSKNS